MDVNQIIQGDCLDVLQGIFHGTERGMIWLISFTSPDHGARSAGRY